MAYLACLRQRTVEHGTTTTRLIIWLVLCRLAPVNRSIPALCRTFNSSINLLLSNSTFSLQSSRTTYLVQRQSRSNPDNLTLCTVICQRFLSRTLTVLVWSGKTESHQVVSRYLGRLLVAWHLFGPMEVMPVIKFRFEYFGVIHIAWSDEREICWDTGLMQTSSSLIVERHLGLKVSLIFCRPVYGRPFKLIDNKTVSLQIFITSRRTSLLVRGRDCPRKTA